MAACLLLKARRPPPPSWWASGWGLFSVHHTVSRSTWWELSADAALFFSPALPSVLCGDVSCLICRFLLVRHRKSFEGSSFRLQDPKILFKGSEYDVRSRKDLPQEQTASCRSVTSAGGLVVGALKGTIEGIERRQQIFDHNSARVPEYLSDSTPHPHPHPRLSKHVGCWLLLSKHRSTFLSHCSRGIDFLSSNYPNH